MEWRGIVSKPLGCKSGDIVLKPMSEEQKKFIQAGITKAREELLALQAKEIESQRLFQTRFEKPRSS